MEHGEKQRWQFQVLGLGLQLVTHERASGVYSILAACIVIVIPPLYRKAQVWAYRALRTSGGLRRCDLMKTAACTFCV